MTNHDENIFFALLRAAVWTGSDGQPRAELLAQAAALIPEGYNWRPLIGMFRDHALLGVVAHCMMRLPEELRPGIDDQKVAMSFLANTIRRGHSMRCAAASLFGRLEQCGCHPVLMKGEGLSLLYPRTCRRTVGDVDIYVPEDEYLRAKRVLADFCGMNESDGTEDDVHIQMHRGKIEFELHRKPFDPIFKSNASAFLAWARQELDSNKRSLVLAGAGKEVFVPGDYFNVIFVYDHMLKHILHETPSLRQFVDLALVLSHAANIGALDHKRFLADIRQYSSLELWQTMSGVLHYQLGMPTDEIPGWNERRAKDSQGMFLEYMITSGNFGRSHAKKSFSKYAAIRKIQHTLYILRFPGVIRREMLRRKVAIYI